MKCLIAAYAALALLLVGCGHSAVLAKGDGTEWDGHLLVGQTVTFGAEIVDHNALNHEVLPANRVTVDDPSLVTIGSGMFGRTLTGIARGKTTLHVYASGIDEPEDATIVVE